MADQKDKELEQERKELQSELNLAQVHGGPANDAELGCAAVPRGWLKIGWS